MIGVTLRRFSTDREIPQFRYSGTLPLVLVFSVTKFPDFFKMETKK